MTYKGRVIRYSKEEEIGAIYYDGKSIVFNRLNLRSKEQYCKVGAECEFNIIDVSGTLSADDIYISQAYPVGKKVKICGEVYDLRDIKTVGLSSGYKVLKAKEQKYLFEESKKRGLDLRFIFITFLDNETYRFFDYNSPVAGDGKCDIEKEWESLKKNIYERINA